MTKHSPHPFSAVRDIPNVFYFTNTHPSRYDPRHYFLTFSNLHSSNKDKYHQYWEEAILILRSSRAEKFKKIGDYLYTAWKTSSHGVDEFWKERKQAESNDDSNDDDFLKTLAWTRKRTLQSARHQLGLAFDALDDNASYPSSSKRPRAPEQVQVENKEEGREENQSDDGASQGSSVSRIVLDIRPLPAPEETSIFYLSGDGSTNCSQKFWTPWIVAEKDISSNIWKYRQTVCKKARELMPLSGSVEKLAVNHVYLFEPSDTSSGLYHAVSAEMWPRITKSTLKKLIPKRVLADLGAYALDLSTMNHSEAHDSVLGWGGDTTVKKVLTNLLADKFLWDASDFNELEMIQHLFNPFLSTFISNIQGGHGRWDKLFLPSQKRKEDAMAEGRGRRPDFFMYCENPGEQCHVFAMEAKKSGQGTVLQNDLEKVGLLMKDAIDTMCKQRINVSEVKVFGLVIVGAEGVVYSMELPARGIYFMKRYAIIYAPRSQHDLHVLAGTINVFMNLREELTRTIRVCKGPTLKNPLNLIRPSFGTPIKVTRTGVKSDFDTSPSLRPRPSSHPQ